MPFHLDILKRHSDPAPCTKKCSDSVKAAAQKPIHSDPDLRRLSASKSPRGTPNSSPSRTASSRRSRALKYRRLSSTGYVSPNFTYFSTTPRRATHPDTSPRKFRRGSLWSDAEELDPWAQFRLKGMSSSVPNGDDKPFMTSVEGGNCYRLRSFSVTSKGVVNLGDFLRQRSQSDASVSSEELEQVFADRRDSAASTTSSVAAPSDNTSPTHRVLLLGSEDVGKTSLVAQFTTSDCLITATNPQASVDGSEERTVSLTVDGEESELICEDPIDSSYEVDDTIYCSTNAFLVIYSIADRKSFESATAILDQLRDLKNRCTYLYQGTKHKAVILVANKMDLVRSRLVSSEEGRSVADRYEVKYVETSVGFNLNVDELLVGIVTQIRLQNGNRKPSSLFDGNDFSARSRRFSCKARGFMNRFLEKCELKTRSCDNLHVL